MHAGLGHLSGNDIADSSKFLKKVFQRQLEEAETGKRKLTVAGQRPDAACLLLACWCASAVAYQSTTSYGLPEAQGLMQ